VPVRYQIDGRTAAEISANVESAVRKGALASGAALPPVRGLAASLGVSPGTVAKAYQALRQRGMVETAGRNGTRVRPRPPVAPTRAAAALPAPPGALDLSLGFPDERLLPALGPSLRRLSEADVDAPAASYHEAGPVPDLVAMARDRLAADGVPVDGITVTGGALDGMERLLTAHLRPGDRVAVEDPGWSSLIDLVAALGMAPVAMPVDDDGPTVDGLRRALAAGARAVIVTTRAQNPTGAAVTADRAYALRGALTDQPDVLLIEDDHAAELATVALHPLAGATRTWAFLRSVSKPYGPDLRLAMLAGDEATVSRVAGRMRLGSGWVSTLLQRLVVQLWRDGDVATAIARARRSYADRRAALREALLIRGLPSHGQTGINVWVPVPDETRTVAALREAGYAVAPGALYRLGSPPALRITISPLALSDMDALADAVRRAVGSGQTMPLGR
jgi:DNA-binding transcriptional MocR family regulator